MAETEETRTPTRATVRIVLPAFNEEASLGPLLERVEASMEESGLDYQVIVVDDGSGDRTAGVAEGFAERMPVRLVRHQTNLGLGASIRDGLVEAARLAGPRDVLVTLDADNTHTPDLILRMVRMVREGHDVVIASRYQPGSRVRGVPLLRRLISRAGNLLLRAVFPTRGVRDYTSGYRAYRAEVLQGVLDREGPGFFKEDGFQVMVDILLNLRRDRDLIFGEAPLILRYDHKEGASKMDVGRTIRDTLRLMASRRLGR